MGNPPGRFEGGNTRRANEQVLGQEFAQDMQLANDLVNWGNNLLDQDIFENINRDKWRFVKIPKQA